MGQSQVSNIEGIFRELPDTFSGLFIDWTPRLMMKDSEEKRRATFQALGKRGGFHFC